MSGPSTRAPDGGTARRLLDHRHSALLGAIVAAFAVRPLLGDTGIALLAFSLALVALLLVALFTVEVDERLADRAAPPGRRRWTRVVGWSLAAIAVIERVEVVLLPSRLLIVLGSISWLLLFGFVVWSQFRGVLRDDQVTGETISKSVSIYLLLGFCWGLLYSIMFQLDPSAFNLGTSSPTSAPSPNGPMKLFPVFIYFSLTTLATIGYGDLTPLSLQARYAAVAEGITGQFYLTVLVARLVGMQMSQAIARDSERHRSDSGASGSTER